MGRNHRLQQEYNTMEGCGGSLIGLIFTGLKIQYFDRRCNECDMGHDFYKACLKIYI